MSYRLATMIPHLRTVLVLLLLALLLLLTLFLVSIHQRATPISLPTSSGPAAFMAGGPPWGGPPWGHLVSPSS